MKIKTLYLKNFQSYNEATINFSPNFNCIIGETNVGKSTIVRAIAFVLSDLWEPSFIKVPEKQTEVTIIFDSGLTISRAKGKGINQVTVNGKVYENFGPFLPEEVKKFIPLRKINIDDLKLNLNISFQDDPLFLLFDSPSYKAKVLHSVTGLSLLDQAIRSLLKDRKNILVKKNQLQQMVSDLKEQLEEYKGLEIQLKTVSMKIQLAQQYKELNEKYLNKNRELNNKLYIKKKYYELQQTLNDIRSRQQEVKNELVKIKTCPFCKQPLPENFSL